MTKDNSYNDKCEFCNQYQGCDIYSMTCDYSNICKQNEECFIKKTLSELKRKEQECDQLKAENGYLKIKNATLQNRNQQMSGCITQNEIYKQALEEIREIQKDCDGCNGDCFYCYSGSGWIFKLSDEVLKGNFEVLDD